jgi:hypothetical protein
MDAYLTAAAAAEEQKRIDHLIVLAEELGITLKQLHEQAARDEHNRAQRIKRGLRRAEQRFHAVVGPRDAGADERGGVARPRPTHWPG